MLLFNFSFGATNPTEIEFEKKENISVETSRILAYDFPGWNRKQAITINSGQVMGSTALTDFPFLVTLDHLNSEVVDGGANSALNGGGDIRFSSDAGGNNPLAIEVVEFVTSATPANRRAQIWVKIPSLSPSADTTIYIWYNKTGEVQPSPSSTYGSEAVWSSNYISVWHLDEDTSGSAPQIYDSTSSSNDGTTVGGIDSNNSMISRIGNGIDLNGSSEFINVGNSQSLNLMSDFSISGWVYPRGYQDAYLMAKRSETVTSGYNILLIEQEDVVYYDGSTFDYTGMLYNTNQWNYVVMKFNASGTGMSVFLNGAFSSEFAIPQIPDGSAQNLYLGARSNGAFFLDGLMDELRVSNTERLDDWIATEYNNQSNPTNFALAGTPEDVSSGGGSGGSGGTALWSETSSDIFYNTGNVGIGTSNIPSAYKLAVNGKIISEEVKVQLQSQWPDYVFTENYSLPSLEEVAKHIKEKGHLINIPSAKEVEVNGIELGEMNKLLLEKIEELTLYIIDLKKDVENLKK